MINRWRLVLATFGAASLMMVACGDDDDEGTGGGVTTQTGTQTGTGGSGGTQTGTTTGGGGNGGAMTCEQACAALFTCAVEECDGMDASMEEVFTDGCPPDAPGCIDTCEATPALLVIINPDDCNATVTAVSGANATFADRCENGIAPCGSGGAGGNG